MTKKNLILSGIAIAVISLLGLRAGQTENGQLAQLWGGKSSSKVKCDLPTKAREFDHSPYYKRPLIDGHLHMPRPANILGGIALKLGFPMAITNSWLNIDYLNCLWESEGIKKVFGFYIVPKYAEGQSVSFAAKNEKKYPGKITPFFMTPPVNALNIGFDAVGNVFKKIQDSSRALEKSDLILISRAPWIIQLWKNIINSLKKINYW